MRPSADWQFLLFNEITRGAFFMLPQIAIGSGKFFERLLDSTLHGSAAEERIDYPILARSFYDDDSYHRYDDAPEGSTAIFTLRGHMFKYGTWWTYGTEEIAAFIMAAVHHKNISSIVLAIDSGGGLVSAVAPIAQAIQAARASGKATIALIDLGCSAAYRVAIECDIIMAQNAISSMVGSIGVMMEFWDIIPYWEKDGFKHHVVYSSHSEHKNKPFELALEGKYDLIKKEILDPLAIEFQTAVKTLRGPKLNTSVEGIISGKTFYAPEALENGLIDEIGNMNQAIQRAQMLAESRKFLSQS